MAKKRNQDDDPKRGTTLRYAAGDAEIFDLAARLEGFSSVPQWLLSIGRRRARLIESASKHGTALRLVEVVVPPWEQSRFTEK